MLSPKIIEHQKLGGVANTSIVARGQIALAALIHGSTYLGAAACHQVKTCVFSRILQRR